jgi:hypothetical protein
MKININCLTPYYHDSVKYIPESLETRGAVNFHKQKITEHANNPEDAGRRLIVLSKLKELNNAFASSDTNEEKRKRTAGLLHRIL